MKRKLMAVLITVVVLSFTASIDAGDILRSYDRNGINYNEWIEENGFRWIKMWDSEHSIRGVQSQSGTTIIPLSRNYYDIFYRPEADHPDGGYFGAW